MQDLKVSIVQTAIEWHRPAVNIENLQERITGLSDKTDLVLLPEMFNTGFTMDASNWYETMDGKTVEWMESIAKTTGLAIGGSLIIRENDQFFNRFVLITNEGVKATYDKRHLFRMANEHVPFSPGQSNSVFEINGWKIRPQICYDLRFPVFARNSWSNGDPEYDLLIYVANWPQVRVSAWKTLLKARAIENLSYCIGVNRIGKDGEGIDYNGQSMVVNYQGDVMNELSKEDTVMTLSLNREELEAYRSRFPAFEDSDRFSIDL